MVMSRGRVKVNDTILVHAMRFVLQCARSTTADNAAQWSRSVALAQFDRVKCTRMLMTVGRTMLTMMERISPNRLHYFDRNTDTNVHGLTNEHLQAAAVATTFCELIKFELCTMSRACAWKCFQH
eukprot:1406884-Amphidinium_carterae.1